MEEQQYHAVYINGRLSEVIEGSLPNYNDIRTERRTTREIGKDEVAGLLEEISKRL